MTDFRVFNRGDVYYVDATPSVGSEMRGKARPGLIVSNDKNNTHSGTLQVVYFTTRDKKELPTHVYYQGQMCRGTILCEHIVTVDRSRIGDFCETVDSGTMELVDKSLCVQLGLYYSTVDPKNTPLPKYNPEDVAFKAKESPFHVAEHKRICEFLHDLYVRKNADYGDSFHQTYLEEGMAASRCKLNDKLSRFKSLTKAGAVQQVSDESVEDTLLDMANFAIMTVLSMRRENEVLDERIKIIADHYGLEHQLDKLKEEIEELRCALSGKDEAHILEEVLDVSILLDQLAYLRGIPPIRQNQDAWPGFVIDARDLVVWVADNCNLNTTAIFKVRNYKLGRTIRRMQDEKESKSAP